MRKFSPHLFLIILTLIGVTAFAVPHTAHAISFDIAGMLFGSMDVLYGVIGKIFWWGLIPLLGVVMGLLGGIVDMALAISFSASFYNTPAIAMAWAILRDLANMIFIFILIYEGIRTILNIGNMTTVKKTIATVVIAALLLNFSLFFTKVIIDASNVAASWFAQGIMNVGGGNSVSDSIRAALQMESLVSQNQAFDGKTLSLQMFTTGFLLTIIQCVAIYVFFKVVFLIIGRIVAFMVLLITSPLGFVGMFVGTIPELSNYAKKWWKELNGQALMLPLFFLMVYITLFIVDRVGVFIADATAGGSGYNSQAAGDPTYYVMFIVIIMLLLRSLKTAEEYSGEIGNMVAGALQKSMTFAGGAMFAGTVGRAASAFKSSDMLQNFAKESRFGKMALMATDKISKTSFGAGSAYKGLIKTAGMDKNPLMKDNFKSADKGYEGLAEDEIKSHESYSKLIKGDDRKYAYAEKMAKGGTGLMGMTLKLVGARGAAESLRKAGGVPQVGSKMLKKDKGIARYIKQQNEPEKKKLNEEIERLEKEKRELEKQTTQETSGTKEEIERLEKEKQELESAEVNKDNGTINGTVFPGRGFDQEIEERQRRLEEINKHLNNQGMMATTQKKIEDIDRQLQNKKSALDEINKKISDADSAIKEAEEEETRKDLAERVKKDLKKDDGDGESKPDKPKEEKNK